MRIGIISPSLRQGGAERIVSGLTHYLADRHDCHLILFDTADRDYSFAGNLIDLNLPEPGRRSLTVRFKNTLRAIRKLRELKRELKLDLALSFLEPANIPNALSGEYPQTKTVLTVHEDKGYPYVRDVQRRITDSLIRRTYGRADKIITVSEGSRRTLAEKYQLDPSAITVTYNPVDIDAIAASSELPLEGGFQHIFNIPNNAVIVAVGRLTLAKGQWHLLRAFTKIKTELPGARLVILGEGELREYLLDLTDKLGLSEEVFFVGFQPNPFKFVSRAAVCAVSSLWEGFGNVIVEALALGVPVVSTDVRSGPREILAPDTDFRRTCGAIELARYGALVRPLDGKFHPPKAPLTKEENLLADAIIKLITDRSVREEYARQGPKRANDFRAEIILGHYERELLELLDA